MGTYTTNKNLYMPTVGENGWGTLVNENFEIIDNFLKPITVSGSTYTFTGNHVGNQSGGSVSATTGTFSGAVTATSFNDIMLKSTGINSIRTLGYMVRYQSASHASIGVDLRAPSSVGNASGNCIKMSYSINATSNFTRSLYLNGLRDEDGHNYFVSTVEGNYTYALKASYVKVTSVQNTDSIKVVCNGKTYTTSAGGSVNLTLAQLNEILQYPSTVTIATTADSTHTGNIIIAPTTDGLYRSIFAN